MIKCYDRQLDREREREDQRTRLREDNERRIENRRYNNEQYQIILYTKLAEIIMLMRASERRLEKKIERG